MALPAGPKSRNQLLLPPAPNGPAAWFEMVSGQELYGWQREVLEVLAAVERPRVAYVQVPRKNGKSRLGAALLLVEACLKPQRHCFAIADSERNLNSVLMREVRDIVGASSHLRDSVLLFKNHIEVPETGSTIETRAANFRATQGINPHVVVVDEVHLQRDDTIWNGMQMAGAAREDALLLGITTPGYDMTSLAHGLYEDVKRGDATIYGRIFEPVDPACAVDDEVAWVEANPRAADPRFLESMRFDLARMPEHEFRRFRLGQWTATEAAWLPAGAWSACRSGEAFDWDARVWLGFDGSYSGDSTALSAANDKGQVALLGCWERPPSHVDKEWRVPRHEVERAVEAAMEGTGAVLLADPPYWQSEIAEWTARWGRRVLEFPTGSAARMAPACTSFYAGVLEGRVADCSSSAMRPTLAAHLSHCVTKQTQYGTVVVKQTDWSPLKIDAAVATIVAAAPALVSGREKKIIVL